MLPNVKHILWAAGEQEEGRSLLNFSQKHLRAAKNKKHFALSQINEQTVCKLFDGLLLHTHTYVYIHTYILCACVYSTHTGAGSRGELRFFFCGTERKINGIRKADNANPILMASYNLRPN